MSITKFGAFVEFEGGQTGMVHISEVANEYVEDIAQYLHKGDMVKVKVLNITDEGKISLSIKKAQPRPQRPQNDRPAGRQQGQGGFSKPAMEREKPTFEDMLKKFQQSSDEKLSDLKRSTNNKQGSAGYSRRGR